MTTPYSLEEKQLVISELTAIKTNLAARGWFPATSGNLSMRVGEMNGEKFTFAITSSGRDKSVNTPEDFLLVDEHMVPVESTKLKPSAETIIHREIYRLTGCGAIFHVHTVHNNLASEIFSERGN